MSIALSDDCTVPQQRGHQTPAGAVSRAHRKYVQSSELEEHGSDDCYIHLLLVMVSLWLLINGE